MDIRRKDIKIFQDLNSSSNGIIGFTMSRRYNMEPREIIDFILKYQEKELITCDSEYKLCITEKGKAALAAQLAMIKPMPKSERSQYFEEHALPFQLDINEPYIPSITFGNDKQNQ